MRFVIPHRRAGPESLRERYVEANAVKYPVAAEFAEQLFVHVTLQIDAQVTGDAATRGDTAAGPPTLGTIRPSQKTPAAAISSPTADRAPGEIQRAT